MEAGNEEKLDELRTQWSETMRENLPVSGCNTTVIFRNEKQNLVWNKPYDRKQTCRRTTADRNSRDHGDGGRVIFMIFHLRSRNFRKNCAGCFAEASRDPETGMGDG